MFTRMICPSADCPISAKMAARQPTFQQLCRPSHSELYPGKDLMGLQKPSQVRVVMRICPCHFHNRNFQNLPVLVFSRCQKTQKVGHHIPLKSDYARRMVSTDGIWSAFYSRKRYQKMMKQKKHGTAPVQISTTINFSN